MSSDVVTGKALQFTNDNKHCYSYSGSLSIDASATKTFLDFMTNSEYIKGQITIGRNVKTSAEHEVFVYLNDVLVFYSKMDNGNTVTNQTPNSIPLELIIPPFTTLKLDIKSADAATTQKTAVFTGRAYMTNRVGNLDE